jgi:hypothetical protein
MRPRPFLAAGLALTLSACSSVETLTARCRDRLTTTAPTLTASAEQAKPSDDAPQPQAPAEGAVVQCVKESAQAEQQARQVATVIALAPLFVAAVAIAGSAPTGHAYRQGYRTTRWRR